LVLEAWLTLFTTATISLVLCLLLSPIAIKTCLLDHPSKRKVHRKPVPLVGGLAIFLTMLTAIFLVPLYGARVLPLILATGLMLVPGKVDARWGLSPTIRFIMQILACCIMIFAGGVVLTDFGSLMWNGVLSLGWLSIPITIFAAVGVINAFNMMDGIDGLSSMIFIVASAAMAWLAMQAGSSINASLLLIAIVACGWVFPVHRTPAPEQNAVE